MWKDVLAVAPAVVAVTISGLTLWNTIRLANLQKRDKVQDGIEQKKYENELKQMSNYMELEIQSSQIFKFTAEKADLMEKFRGDDLPKDWRDGRWVKERETTLNLFFQSLNLFEVCARMRKKDQMFPAEVFASWVSWFTEILESRFFRAEWPTIRTNYTDDVRTIFDVGVDIWETLPPDQRIANFYKAVAWIMRDDKDVPCAEIAEWPRRLIEEELSWEKIQQEWTPQSPTPGINPPALPATLQPLPAG